MEKLENQVVGSHLVKCDGRLDKPAVADHTDSLPVDAVVLIRSNGTTQVLCPYYDSNREGKKDSSIQISTCILHGPKDGYRCPYRSK